jgi:hypothetical protein
MPVSFLWREAYSLDLREDYKLRVCGNSMSRRIFGPKNEEITEVPS